MNGNDSINDLIEKLIKVGYSERKIKVILLNHYGKSNLDKLSPEEEEKVKNTLQYYLNFAQKCIKIHTGEESNAD